MESQREYLIRLREILVKRFDVEELRTLCFDLGIDYGDLGGEGRPGKARELVALLERQNRIPELVARGKQLRPDAAWDTDSAAPRRQDPIQSLIREVGNCWADTA